MAAVTVNRRRRAVMGSRNVWLYDIDIAADGDTLDTTLARVDSVQALSETNNAIGATTSRLSGPGGKIQIAFQTAGAENNVLVMVVGL